MRTLPAVEQRVSFVTVATADLDAARAFYLRGLGWRPLLDVPGEVLFLQVGHGLVLSLYDAARFAADLDGAPGADVPPAGVTLAHNVGSEAEVDEVARTMAAAGAQVLTLPRRAAFGGYHAHLRDPVGVLWEVAHNPSWRVRDDGTVDLGAPPGP
jgi:catechol 2,3-dioxygenase-like lactoylglutathione lyase family enzyme